MLREFECPLLPLADLPEVTGTEPDQQADDLDAEAARLSAYRERLEKEIRVAEEKTRIEALLVRRASARPPAPVRDSEVTCIRPLPTSRRTASPEQQDFARPLLTSTLTRSSTRMPVVDEPWSDASALTDAAIVVDHTRITSEPRPASHPFFVPVFGVALALLLAAFVTRGEDRSAAFGSFAGSSATAPAIAPAIAPATSSLPARVEAPMAALTTATATPPMAPIALAAPTTTSIKRSSPRRTTRQAVMAAPTPSSGQAVSIDSPVVNAPIAPAAAAAPPVPAPASSPELEQAARTARMLRAQLDGVVVE